MSDRIDIRHGKLVISVPKGWEDVSSMVFLGPPDPGLDAPLAPGNAKVAYRPSLGVSYEVRPADVESPKDFLSVAAQGLKLAKIKFDEVESYPLQLAGRDGHCSVRRLDLGQIIVRQLVAVSFMGAVALVATASMPEATHKSHLPLMKELLGALRWE